MKKQLAVLLCAVSSLCFAGEKAPGEYVAHEWGTFTSVQGADGGLIPWNPLKVEELPEFVYSLAWPQGKGVGQANGLALKASVLALQRMETPVIYFYADEPQTVDVSVKFPRGIVTEWYPRAAKANTFGELEVQKQRLEQGLITWNKVRILPKTDSRWPRNDGTGSHYYAARTTEANSIEVKTPRGAEIERFLFYRGVGAFGTPLKVMQQGEHAETIEVKNTGTGALRHLLVYRVSGNEVHWKLIRQLGPEESKTVQLPIMEKPIARTEFEAQAGMGLRKALAAEGLYEPEAEAMVKTWTDSWFAEQGTRVLYILPTAWTEETLPLALSPAPKEVARVMVGRAELITPAIENAVTQEIVRFGAGDAVTRSHAVANVRKLGLGRFTEAVVRRIVARQSLTREQNDRAWELLQLAGREGKQLAQR